MEPFQNQRKALDPQHICAHSHTQFCMQLQEVCTYMEAQFMDSLCRIKSTFLTSINVESEAQKNGKAIRG